MTLSDIAFNHVIFILAFTISALSLAGSAFSLIIFSRKVFQKCPMLVYFKALSIIDSFVFVYFLMTGASLLLDVDLMQENTIVCKAFYFVTVSISPNVSWLLVIFSFDQLVRVTMSSRFAAIKRFDFQVRLIVIMVVLHLVHASYIITQVKIVDLNSTGPNNVSRKACDYPVDSILPVFFLFESSFLPFLIMTITTGLILKVLFKSRNTLKKYASPENENSLLASRSSQSSSSRSASIVGASSSALGVFTTVQNSNNNNNNTINCKSSSCRNIKFACNSIVFNVLFILLCSPSIFAHLLSIDNYQLSWSIKAIGFLMFNFYFLLHFWIHFCVNSIFRQEVFVILGIDSA